MKKVLIFGATGFIGQTVSKEFAQRNWHTIPAASSILRQPDIGQISDFLKQNSFDHILYLAGVTRLKANETGSAFYEGNFLPIVRLANALEKIRLQNVPVYTMGSAAELGKTDSHPQKENALCRPHTDYGMSKFCQTEYIKQINKKGFKFSVLRPFNVAGKSMNEFQTPLCFVKRLQANPNVIETGALRYIRDFIHVSDLAKVIIRLVEKEWNGELINVCSGKGHTSHELLLEAIKQMKINPEIKEDTSDSPGNYHNLGDTTYLNEVYGQLHFSPEKCIKEILST